MLKLKKASIRTKLVNALLKFTSLRLNGVYLKKKNLLAANITIGVGTRINGRFLCKGNGSISLGKYCALGENIKALTTNHNLKTLNLQVNLNHQLGVSVADPAKKDIVIGNNVWIGDNTVILPGVIIGDGAIIGACSVVTKSIEPYSINAGNPTRQIRFRYKSDEIRNQLAELQWWDWSVSKMRKNKDFFAQDFDSMSPEELSIAINNLL